MSKTETTTTTTQKPVAEPGYVQVPAHITPAQETGQPLIKPAQPATTTETTVTVEKE